MNVISNLSGAALVKRGRANVAWVKANMQSIVAMAAPPQETTFADKLTKAVAARLPTARTVKQAKEQGERERSRYKPFKRRQRTKSD